MVTELALSWCSTRMPASCEEEPAATVVVSTANRMIPSSCFSLIITLSPHAARRLALRARIAKGYLPFLRLELASPMMAILLPLGSARTANTCLLLGHSYNWTYSVDQISCD